MNDVYQITLSVGDRRHVLTYELENHRPVKVWKELLSQHTYDQLRLNPFRGNVKHYQAKVQRLNSLIEEINSWIPTKIQGYWDNENVNESLNRLHIHFPEQEKIETDYNRRNQLTEYNDVIHEIEFMVHADKKIKSYILVCLEKRKEVPLEKSDYTLFDIRRNFGDLLLHYPHVGRHPLELAVQNDLSCPADQIVCQHTISADHSLRFSDFHPADNDFEKFYYSSNINWPYPLEDKRLAVGYIRLGSLVRVDQKIKSQEEILSIVNHSDKILSWNFL